MYGSNTKVAKEDVEVRDLMFIIGFATVKDTAE